MAKSLKLFVIFLCNLFFGQGYNVIITYLAVLSLVVNIVLAVKYHNIGKYCDSFNMLCFAVIPLYDIGIAIGGLRFSLFEGQRAYAIRDLANYLFVGYLCKIGAVFAGYQVGS